MSCLSSYKLCPGLADQFAGGCIEHTVPRIFTLNKTPSPLFQTKYYRSSSCQVLISRSTSCGSRCAYRSSVASSYNNSLYDSNYVAVNWSLNASMMTDNMNIMTALYSTSRKIEPVEILAVLSIHWCICEINSYKIIFLTLYSVTNLFEFREGYVSGAMVSVDMCEILHVLWEQDNKV